MVTDSNKLSALFARWKDEHRQIDARVAELCQWIHSQGKIVTPPFLRAAQKLGELRDQLETHFVVEEELGRLLADARGGMTAEIDSVRQQHDREHTILLERLGRLIHSLGTAEPEFDSWDAATNEFELFVDKLEQHEEREAESVGWLSVNAACNDQRNIDG
ncbi:MAG: hemerythrin domain-containing protein [Planctomycetales bacterium]|nr:hemerythrin domain-containing protein [Planctomycetales bacterium]MCA9181307.1 hemerythrin domain-containing protein [Planctomycetales bacterium]